MLKSNAIANDQPGIENPPSSPAASQHESESSAMVDFAPGLESAFPSEFPEYDCRLECIQGNVPESIDGVYYLNGPARFGMNDFRYQHWLDGDGMVCALRFDHGRVHLKSRYIQSNKYRAESEACKPLFRAFGTTFPDSRLNSAHNGLESPVNVSVYPFHDCLLAFGEQGLPWELDPQTLETRGEYNFNGRLNAASPFSAHPKFDVESGEMFNFGIFFSPQTPKLYFYCFGREGLRYRKAVAIEYPCSVHDFALSKNYAVFYLSPYLLNLQPLLKENATLMDSLSWQPERGSRLLVISRKSGELIASLPVGNRYCLHLINAYEQDNKLIVDLLEFDEPIYPEYQPIPHLFQHVAVGGPVRFSIDTAKAELSHRISLDYRQAPEFPAIDTRQAMRAYDDFWMLGISATGQPGRKFFDRLVHANWNRLDHIDLYQSPRFRYLGGEPVFIAYPGSSRGVILCQEFAVEERRSSFLLFDAHEVRKGPIARITGDLSLYLGFHATFQATAH